MTSSGTDCNIKYKAVHNEKVEKLEYIVPISREGDDMFVLTSKKHNSSSKVVMVSKKITCITVSK